MLHVASSPLTQLYKCPIYDSSHGTCPPTGTPAQGGYTAVTKFYKPPVLKQALTGIRSLIETMNTRICQLAAKQHALCVGDYHIFNGPHGTAPMPQGSFTAKYGDLNQLGQNKIAAAIVKLGWAPLKIR